MADTYTESEYYTTDTSVDLSAIAPDGDLSITVAAVTSGTITAVERLRAGMDAFVDPGVSTEAPTVQEGMDLLASTRVRTTPDLVEVTVSSRLLAVIQGWSL